MKSHERMNLTPLEQAVWAVAYVLRGATLSIENADAAVESLRAGLAQERQAEQLTEAKAMHWTNIVTSKRSGVELRTVRCSCGYEPPRVEGYDADEMMALHLAMMKAQGPEDIK